ncbi:hypothetical protein DBIPINDM_006506 [Mesorhizobium sp. AR02]|uniref:hypothetical protein n=1 Tax=Mesorhizobium sp. AR02 TaxID=2865837 RepID=UPI00215FC177|nr:hypothetical protein [Mesorhizobium sp. AR02]UVK53053.1 hypothetical protein DBIPINDM_006506 [Mesorhizobium sp. AR02]
MDFAVLGANGHVDRCVSIGPSAHHEIISIASDNAFEFILQFQDFYEDATVSIESLPSLTKQVAELQRIEGISEESKSFLTNLADLIRYAVEQSRPIEALAD